MPSYLHVQAALLLLVTSCASTPPPELQVATPTAMELPPEEPPKRSVPEGHLRREDVMAVLSEGAPSLLQKIEVEPRIDRDGHFSGWRIVAIRDPLLASGDLQTGDIVRWINGQAIENPYQFFEVFQSLAFAPELHFQIERGAETKDFHYPIHDDPSAPPIPRATIQAPSDTSVTGEPPPEQPKVSKKKSSKQR